MYKRLLALSVIFGILFLSGCQNSESPSGSSPEQGPSSDVSQSSSAANTYRYDNIPDFPIPNIFPQKITYFKAMLGETTVIVDTEKIAQVIEILGELEVSDAPTKKETDDETIYQVIGIYQNADDEEPAYALYFLVDSMYIETNGTISDVYPTPNWINVGLDETTVNSRLRQLIDKWAWEGLPPRPQS